MSVEPIERAREAYAYPLLIKHLLHTPLAIAPDREIVYRDHVRLTYRQLRDRIGQLASGLAKMGVKPGDVVAVMDWDSHRYLECFFAAPMMGAVLQTVNIRLTHEQILYTLNHARPKILLVNAEFLPIVEALADRIESVEKYVLLSDEPHAAPSAVPFDCEYEILLLSGEADFAFPDFDENARATTFYTTGTTGLPKGVSFSHRQLVLHTLAETAALALAPAQGRLHRDDVYMPMTPMFHVHAWGVPYAATMAGLKQVYPGRYTPESLMRLKQREGVTFSHCVPTILHMILSHPDSAAYDLSNWKVIIGGSALPTGLAEAALARGIDVFAGYGMSETCPILTLAHVKPELLKDAADQGVGLRVKTGLPIPLVDLRIVDSDMKDAPHDGKATGEIVARAPWLAQAYLNNPEASNALWAGGWLHTNDIANIDAQGYVQVTDRLKDVIKTGGEWISSLEIEDLISQHPLVSEVAVIGVKDPKWGERPKALVVAKCGAAVDAEAIRAFLAGFAERGLISKYGVPQEIELVEALIKTSVGKINKRALRELFGG
ncbi:fatty-acyl-CoA synthase [Rhodoblastus acidophilus]|uniref:Fatty-acyl-CoA synthase n=1 Tax=Rhodoblastus acidophilus TaxID=1074 RepID=A0A212QZ17_RHOAC|nr:fatty acid--CoA ligase [Rhodoblastus acidophilus]PPQ40559.1 long-chain fatty acid--CoA ligase [Rhodoblastus acidophilus]RAI20711.1 long-chain fatty acid--CoA ligase [Rhodoblastus acidophilus]SNB64932.1 fatty-acyl-CoA synthase [Rhodoblastus acidophilus]